MNPILLNDDVQQYLALNEATALTRFVLRGSPFEGITAQELAQQLEGRQKVKNKLPSWYSTKKIYYPPKVNLEQTSSALTARHKSAIHKAETVADLTGGFGIDSYFFAQKAKKVTYYEWDWELARIAAHNFERLNAENISVKVGDGIKMLLDSDQKYDLVYVDPSRRNDLNQKVFLLRDCAPNIPENLDAIFAHTANIMVKTSPMLDIVAGINELDPVSAVHIVAVKNEVKELLFILNKEVKTENLQLVTANINTDGTAKTSCPYFEALVVKANFSEPLRYLYEPNAALMKSGLFNWIGESFDLKKIAANSHLYTADEVKDFPGRIFEIKHALPYHKKTISKSFGGSQANITSRNFRESVAQLRKKFKIRDGGKSYLFFTTDYDDRPVVLSCEKI